MAPTTPLTVLLLLHTHIHIHHTLIIHPPPLTVLLLLPTLIIHSPPLTVLLLLDRRHAEPPARGPQHAHVHAHRLVPVLRPRARVAKRPVGKWVIGRWVSERMGGLGVGGWFNGWVDGVCEEWMGLMGG